MKFAIRNSQFIILLLLDLSAHFYVLFAILTFLRSVMGIIAYCLQIDPLQETTQGGLAIPALRFFFYQFLIVSVTRFKSTGWIYLSHSLPLSFCHSGEIQGGQWQDLRRSAWLCCWSPPRDQSIVKWSWNEWRFSQTWFLNYLPLSNCLHFVLSHRWPPRRTQAIPAKLVKKPFLFQ